MLSNQQQPRSLPPRPAASDVRRAWERFVDGEDDLQGVRPEVAISWQRSRDQYHIDPFLSEAPVADTQERHSLDQDVVFTELGFSAATMTREVANAGGVVVVADAAGTVLTAWGDRETHSIATESGLAPWFCWNEGSVGTNGLGTALETSRPVMIRQSEHWCRSFHDWSCGAIAVRDVVSKKPIAVLNISCWRSDLPTSAQVWLENAVTRAENTVRRRAYNSGSELLAAYSQAHRQSDKPLVAVDTDGAVVIADDKASVILGVPAATPALDAAVRWTPQLPSFIQVARFATIRADADADWTGTTQIFTLMSDEPSPIRITPVFLRGTLIGHLIAFTGSSGEHFTHPLAGQATLLEPAARIVAMREENRMVLLEASEVAAAESDGNGVWLITNEGRVRAASPTLDRLDAEMGGRFMRVHRQYIVNLSRVREVERREKGELTLVMNDPDKTSVPVSRRNARGVRRALNI